MNDCDYLIIFLDDICINIKIKSLKRFRKMFKIKSLYKFGKFWIVFVVWYEMFDLLGWVFLCYNIGLNI